MKRIELIDVSGRVWLSDPDVDNELAGHEDDLLDLFRDFGSLNHLAMEIEGVKRFFNPANIVSAALVDFATPAETTDGAR